MKKFTLASAAFAAVMHATPALADPTLSVGGQIFTDYSMPMDTNGSAKHAFNVSRAFLSGKVSFNENWSGNITYNIAPLSYMKTATTAGIEPANAVLQLAYAQWADQLMPNQQLQLGIITTPWADYEFANWGYRMLGSMASFGGLAGTVTGARVSGSAIASSYDKGLKVSGSNGFITYGLGVLNGEGHNASETDGQKAYQGRLSFALLNGLDWTLLAQKGNPQPTATVNQADAYSTGLSYSAYGAKISGQYTQTNTGIDKTGNILTGFAFIPVVVLPADLVLRADMITPDTTRTDTNRLEGIIGLSFKPTKGVTLVLDDQIVNNTVSGNTLMYNVLALHSMIAF